MNNALSEHGNCPNVSVVIPAYNRAAMIDDCLASVAAQEYPRDRVEIIVVDDGSTDDTRERAASHPGVRVFRQNHLRSGAARNRGIREARGEYIAFLDSDDIWEPCCLRMEIDLLRAAPAVGVVVGNALSFGASEDQLLDMVPHIRELEWRQVCEDGYVLEGNVLGTLLKGSFVSTSTVLVRRDLVDENSFDTSLPRWQDYDLWLRLASRTRFGFVDRILVRQRQHAGNASRTPDLVGLSAMRMIRKIETGILAISSRTERRRAIARWARLGTAAYLQARMYGEAAACLRKSCVAFDVKFTARLLWNHLKTEPAVRSVARSLGLLKRP